MINVVVKFFKLGPNELVHIQQFGENLTAASPTSSKDKWKPFKILHNCYDQFHVSCA